jgi:hypothetical protein
MTNSNAYLKIAGKYFTFDSRLKIISAECELLNCEGNEEH